MSSFPNSIIKKNNTLGIKPIKKSIQINISINSSPNKFLFSNNVNKIASSYLSMGKKIQINKSRKASKILQINTISNSNYYTLNSKEAKEANQTYGSLTNSLINNSKNNYINHSNINFNIPQQQQTIYINKVNDIKSKYNKKTNLSKLRISNESLGKGFQYKNDIPKGTATLLDSKNKIKKIPVKSKIKQYKNQNKTNKSISSTSFNNNTYIAKKQMITDKNISINNNTNNLIHRNIFYDKNNHIRNFTTNFKNKEILNIFHNKTLSNNHRYNNINNINNRSESNSNLDNMRVNNSINSRGKIKLLDKDKISDMKIDVNSIILSKKENKSNSINNNVKNHHKFYYSKYLSSKYNDNIINNNYNIIDNIKIYIPDNINIGGIKNMKNKTKEFNKINKIPNNKISNRKISTIQCKKIIPSKKNIKINLNKILIDKKINKDNIQNYNNTLNERKFDYSLSKINDALSKKLVKNKNEENNNNLNNNKNIDNKYVSHIKNEYLKKNNNSHFVNNDIFKKINKNSYLIEYNKENTIDINKIYLENIDKNKINEKRSFISNPDKKLEILKRNNILNSSNNLNLNIKINNNSNDNKTKKYSCNNNKNNKEFYNIKNNAIILNKKNNSIEINKKIINSKICNCLFNEENLDEFPNDYDEEFNDLYSIRNKIKFQNILINNENIFSEKGNDYLKYKEKFDKMYDKIFVKKRISLPNSGYKTKKNIEVTSNTKTNYSSSSKKYNFNPNFGM